MRGRITVAETFDQRHLIALYTAGLINELPQELGPMPVGPVDSEIVNDLHRWGVVDPTTGGLTPAAHTQLAGVVAYDWALSGIVLLYSERRAVEVELPLELLQAGVQYSLRDIPRVTFLIGYRDNTLTTLALARGHLSMAIDTVENHGPHSEYRAAAAVIAALLDPAGRWQPYPMAEVSIPAAAAAAAARPRDHDSREVLDATTTTLTEANMGVPTVRGLTELLAADNVATAQIVLTHRTPAGKRRLDNTAAGVMFFDAPTTSGTVVSYPATAIDRRTWITYQPATLDALTTAVTALHTAHAAATPFELRKL